MVKDVVPATASRTSYGRVALYLGCWLVITVCITWAFLVMRAVMAIGGSCASGGPYVIATPCPDGAWLIAIAIPAMLIAAFVSWAGPAGTPILLVPMWALLFGALGWNFWEFGIADGSVGAIVCGVVFAALAAPAVIGIGWSGLRLLRHSPAALGWWAALAIIGAAGLWLGVSTYTAIAA